MAVGGVSSSDKVLVTGAGGFIGSHLTEALCRAGADVCALVHYNSRNTWSNLEHLENEVLRSIRVVAGDINDLQFMRSIVKGRSIVFHLAALISIPYSYSSPFSYVATNVQGTLNVLQAALDRGVERLIHTSTSEVYGTAQYVPIDEKHPLQAQSPYAASKIAADKLAESFFTSFDLPVVTLRPFNTYGPRQSARAIIPTIVTQALSGQKVRLGNLLPVRDINFVTDTVNGFLLASKASGITGQVINIGSGIGISIGELVIEIHRSLGISPETEEDLERIRPEKSEVMALICAAQRARELIGWTPLMSLQAGLKQTIDWIADNLNLYKAEIYNV